MNSRTRAFNSYRNAKEAVESAQERVMQSLLRGSAAERRSAIDAFTLATAQLNVAISRVSATSGK